MISRRGFTLIELLVAIGIIVLFFSVLMFLFNPFAQDIENRNEQRKTDVNTILNAVYQYAQQNGGRVPPGITTTRKEICTSKAHCTHGIDLDVLTGSYLSSIPADPNATGTGTDYLIVQADNRIVVIAPNAEQNLTISVAR